MSEKSYYESYQTLTDEQLVQRIQQRRPKSRSVLNELLRRHHVNLLLRCHRYLRNWDDAEDAVQETELRMFRAIGAYKGEAAFRTWLYAIADNQCHTLMAKRMRNVLGEHLRALLQHAEETRKKSLQNQSEQIDLARLVERLLKSLPTPAAEILSLRFFYECSMEDIAQILGIGLSAAKMRLYRSLQLAETLFPDKTASLVV